MSPTRTALYLRYSSPNQAKRGGVSLLAQLTELQRAAEAAGEEIVETLVDQAKTGTSMHKREEFKRVMQLAREGAIDRVRAESVDRTSRNELDRRLFEAELQKYNVDLVYLGETAGQAPEQLTLSRGIRGVVAEHESMQLSQRVYSRMRVKAAQGKWRGGPVNYGLQPDGQGWFVPDPETFPVLLYILNRLADGVGRHRICGELNRGISIDGEPPAIPPTPHVLQYRKKPYIERMDAETGDITHEPKPEPSLYWGISTIKLLLDEAAEGVYAGIYRWGDNYPRRKLPRDRDGKPKQATVFQHDPLIPDELIAKLRRIKAEAPKRKGGRYSTYLLRPTCGRCGGPMRGSSYVRRGKRRRYYVCTQGRKLAGVGPCNAWSAGSDVVEQKVLQTVADRLKRIDPEALQRRFEAVVKAEIGRLRTTIYELNTRISEGQRMKDDTMRYLLSFGTMLAEEMRLEMERTANDAIKELEQRQRERTEAEAALTELRRHPRILGSAGALDLSAVETVKAALNDRESVAYDPLRRALELLVESVTLTPTPEHRRGTRPEDTVLVDVEMRDWNAEIWRDVLRRPRMYGLNLDLNEDDDDEPSTYGGVDEDWPEDL